MPPDANDHGSPFSEAEEQEDESGIMAEEKNDRASTEEHSPTHASNGKLNAKPNAKDPSRPRRKKARRACFACQRAHLTCGTLMPDESTDVPITDD